MPKIGLVTCRHYCSVTDRHCIDQAVPKWLGLSFYFWRVRKPSPGPRSFCIPRQHQCVVHTEEFVELGIDMRPARRAARRFGTFLNLRSHGYW